MKKTKRLWALLLVMVMALGLITTAFAAPTIDSGRKASLSLYKYDITAASADGVWDAASYLAAFVVGKNALSLCGGFYCTDGMGYLGFKHLDFLTVGTSHRGGDFL